jgi:hypothetical protein
MSPVAVSFQTPAPNWMVENGNARASPKLQFMSGMTIGVVTVHVVPAAVPTLIPPLIVPLITAPAPHALTWAKGGLSH